MPSKTDYVSASIIEDSDNDNVDDIHLEEVPKKIKKTRQVQKPLQKFYKEDANIFEIGVDEAGRGPLFGRVYTAAVVLPKDDSFDHSRVKDSKKFNSKKSSFFNYRTIPFKKIMVLEEIFSQLSHYKKYDLYYHN